MEGALELLRHDWPVDIVNRIQRLWRCIALPLLNITPLGIVLLGLLF